VDIGEIFEAGLIIGFFALMFWCVWQLLKMSMQWCGALAGFNLGIIDEPEFWHPAILLTAWAITLAVYGLFVWIF
jgi:hypothetical protein